MYFFYSVFFTAVSRCVVGHSLEHNIRYLVGFGDLSSALLSNGTYVNILINTTTVGLSPETGEQLDEMLDDSATDLSANQNYSTTYTDPVIINSSNVTVGQETSFLSLFGRLSRVPGDSLTAHVQEAIHLCENKKDKRSQKEAMQLMIDISLFTIDHLASQSQKLRAFMQRNGKNSAKVNRKMDALDRELTKRKLVLDAVRSGQIGSETIDAVGVLTDEQKKKIHREVEDANGQLQKMVQGANSQIMRSFPGIAFEKRFPGMIYRGTIHHGRSNALNCHH